MSPLASARRATRLLSLRRTFGCWARALAAPVRRAAEVPAACAWVVRPLELPRLRRGPLLGTCLPAVLDGMAAPGEAWGAAPGEAWGAAPGEAWGAAPGEAWGAAPGKEPGGKSGGVRGTAPGTAGAATPPPPRRPPDRGAVVCSERHEVPRSAPSVSRELLCRLADEPAGPPAAGTARRAPVTATVARRPGPPPCAPDAALAPATARAARRLAAGVAAPARQHVLGPTATAPVLYRHASALRSAGGRRFAEPDVSGQRAAQPDASTMRPARLPASGRGPGPLGPGRRGRPGGSAGHDLNGPDPGGAGWPTAGGAAAGGTARPETAWPASRGESGPGRLGDAGPAAGRARRRHAAWPEASAVDSGAARRGGPHGGAAWSEGGSGAPPRRARGDQPTASERLGAAPVVTSSHPALVAPEPIGASAIPAASGTLRRGAARDAQPPDFLDNAELTARMAQVLRDEARRHGIGV